MNETHIINGVILTGKEAYTIPCLAMIGAASIIGAGMYGAYKLGSTLGSKIFKKSKDDLKEEA